MSLMDPSITLKINADCTYLDYMKIYPASHPVVAGIGSRPPWL